VTQARRRLRTRTALTVTGVGDEVALNAAQCVHRLCRTARDVLHAGALRLALQLVGHLLMIVIWVAALLGAAHPALAVIRDPLRLLAFVGICAAVGALAIVLVTS
jgi:hypothetical protein